MGNLKAANPYQQRVTMLPVVKFRLISIAVFLCKRRFLPSQESCSSLCDRPNILWFPLIAEKI